MLRSQTVKSKKLEGANVSIYLTLNELLISHLTNNSTDVGISNDTMILSAFLYLMDSIANEIRGGDDPKKAGDFCGFGFRDSTQFSVVPVITNNDKYKARLFIETPYGKRSSSLKSKFTLARAAEEISKEIIEKGLDSISKNYEKSPQLFRDKLKEMGYTPDDLISQLSVFEKKQEDPFLEYAPVSLYLVDNTTYKTIEKSRYNNHLFEDDLIKHDTVESIFDLTFFPSKAEVVRGYQEKTNTQGKNLIMRFTKYLLEVSYREDASSIVGLMVEGRGKSKELKRYNRDMQQLKPVETYQNLSQNLKILF